MSYTFEQLRDEYARLLSTLRVTHTAEVNATANRLLRYRARYAAVSEQTGVPLILLATLHNRESDADFTTYLGNGEKLNRVTRLVPKGRGPFASWEAGAIDALAIDGLSKVKDWTWEKALYYGELWNGFGPRNRGIHTGYLWSGTNSYTRGKYISDGVWDANHIDTQLGIVPIMKRMVEIDPTLDLPGTSPPEDVPVADGFAVQRALNTAGFGPLNVDGDLGPKSCAAILVAIQKAGGR